ncbi:AzlC family ABC transporter permease [Protaetiibacter intestinalis]|uniref:Branched-chain amino acid ABC transporter permease n=1 Tax=Protaetiibacter intestinalis TaxID=2419774 RepID=A0A387BC31_9MICO|nr:AzlC family ABC transporter permease [Protaetiibacter intestinalis]AYF98655.1 branched-chain amino acid ABC transporter permease [Protaetiibacter intestinalis]
MTSLDPRARVRAAVGAGIRDSGLIVVAYIPFGLAMGAALVTSGVDPWLIVSSSVVVFAGAAQLAGIQLLGAGASIALVVLTILVINARHLLYSASLEPHLAEWPRGLRMLGAFLLADPVYALAIARFERPGGAGARGEQYGYYFAAGVTCLVGWTTLTGAGVLLGGIIPDDIPLGLAIPLTFLLLLLPLVKDSAGAVAAIVGGIAALLASGLPLGLSTLVGAAAGLVAGGIVLARTRRDEPEPAPETPDAGAADA